MVALADMVDVLLLIDRDEAALTGAAQNLPLGDQRAVLEPFVLDVTDGPALAELATRSSELGTLRAVARAAGISPSMSDWRQVLTVGLVGTAMVIDALEPLVTSDTAIVCFASIAATLAVGELVPSAVAALDEPLDPQLLERIHEALGQEIENTDAAYGWAKLGVRRLVQREAVRFGRRGARICSVSPGMIDTPMTRLEAEVRSAVNGILLEETPLGREGRPEEVSAAAAFLISDEASYQRDRHRR
jgi:NAD(P)-dependent dehydrogenase (short-subunit alcohol dehydrogenase family)